MTITRINPELLHETPGYHHVTIVESRRLAFIAGQCPIDRSGALVGVDDVEAQIDQVAANAAAALATAGVRPDHVIRSVIYVASNDQTTLAAVWRRFNASAIAASFTTASTLLCVAQVGFRGQLVELDLTAALDG
jgi:enamine deaminase RidA (YjgF/YER057c/UK114 family)